jgi:hypothetical protein
MKSESTRTGVAELLRDPGVCIEHARDDANTGGLIAFLLALAVAGSAAFGFAIGSFAGWDVALVDAAKFAGITLFSFALCCPTLYVFASLGGCRLPLARLVAVGLLPMAVLGCLLAALAPIMWLFSVSTESVGFIVLFSCALAAVAAYFAQRPMTLAREKGIVASSVGMRMWFFILIIVALQTVTLVRPMLAPLGAARHPQGKCFFLEHFSRTIIDRH